MAAVTRRAPRRCSTMLRPVLDHVLELVPEVLQEALHRPRRRRRRTRRSCGLRSCSRRRPACRGPAFVPCPARIRVSDAVHPAGAFAARRALAARLGVVEARDALEHVCTMQVVSSMTISAPVPSAEPAFLQRVVVHVRVHHDVAGHDRHRRAARDHRLQLAAAAHAAADLEQILERNAERQLEVAAACSRDRRPRRSSCRRSSATPRSANHSAPLRRIVGTEA